MDVTSLPSEMLVIILKHIATEELLRLRKTNLVIDSAANYGKLARTLVSDIFVFRRSYDSEVRLYRLPNLDYSQLGHIAYTWKAQEGFIDNFATLMKKITILNSINFGENIPINSKFLTTIEKNRPTFRNVRKFYSFVNGVNLSKEEVKRLINVLPKLDNLHICMDTPSNNIHNAEVLGNRKWTSLTVNISEEPRKPMFPELDDEFLVKVVSNCDFFHFIRGAYIRTNFTVMGVLIITKTLLARGAFNKQHQFGKLQLGEIRHDQVEGLFNNLIGAYVVVTPAAYPLTRRITGDTYQVHFVNAEKDSYFINFQVCLEL